MRRTYGHRAKCTACSQRALACAFREVADGALGDAILEVGIDATEGELLSRVVAGLLESVVVETPVGAMVMVDSYVVLGGEGLEGAFGLDSLRG